MSDQLSNTASQRVARMQVPRVRPQKRPRKTLRRRVALLEMRVQQLDGWLSEALAHLDVYRRLFEKVASGQVPMDLALELVETGVAPF